VVGMSGGVDSSVAAALLVEQRFEVVGVTLRVWPWKEPEDPTKKFGSCCSPETADDARQVARRLGIPYYLLNTEREFDQSVVENFAAGYSAGRTPSPCVVCNREVKFGTLRRRALAWEASAVATGHYARVEHESASGRTLLRRARDLQKDQSYVLFNLTQRQLGRSRFPLGALSKEQVRRTARALGLPTADKPDSQDVCFVRDGTKNEFLRKALPQAAQRGEIVDRDGVLLGHHEGLLGYTVGQREGLGIAVGSPRYVVALDPERNRLVVGARDELLAGRCTVNRINWVSIPEPRGPLRAAVRIRSRHEPAPATLQPRGDGCALIEFDQPQAAVTPGQAAVFYQDDLVLGGGWIAS